MLRLHIILYFAACLFLHSCTKNKKTQEEVIAKEKTQELSPVLKQKPEGLETPKGMVWIPGGDLNQGSMDSDKEAMAHEKPQHNVSLDGFFMDIHEVTNKQYAEFVRETGYVTIAEREINWEEMKKQLPPNTPKPHDSILQPGSLIFKTPNFKVKNLHDFSQWWEWKIGANWKNPYGPKSTIAKKDNYPVVHIAYEDALAYCKWKGRRLPTEAEWEYAAKGGVKNAIYSWGLENKKLTEVANTWDGEFPNTNEGKDGFTSIAPTKSYPPNGYGLYDMAGNVWEHTQDWYNSNYYKECASNSEAIRNPQGAIKSFNPNNPNIPEKVIKGGSFLCNANYCASYRVSARMGNSLDSAQEHLGFRTVK